MKRRFTVAILTAAFAVGVAAPPASAGDKDCADFKTWRQAQNFFKKHGGPSKDPHRLDGDDDGIACEALR
ncbi:MAG: competence protein ComEC [Solirubrobacterales bacterium]|jgi:hypothetical protein|nr:competence protein ComEC [Solirubrobacterales bacterium]